MANLEVSYEFVKLLNLLLVGNVGIIQFKNCHFLSEQQTSFSRFVIFVHKMRKKTLLTFRVKGNIWFYSISFYLQGVHKILCFFSFFCWIFSDRFCLHRWCSTCHLAVLAWSPVYTYWHRGKQRKVRVRNIFKIFGKKHNN